MAKMRLDKMLSHMGYGTRSEVRLAVKKRYVSVDGEIVRDPGMQIDPEKNTVTWTGEKVIYKENVYLMMNKPGDVITATEDPRDKTVIDLIEAPYAGMKLFPVGRLDKDTEGLLLITTDGDFSHKLTAPKKKVPKVYQVTLDASLEPEMIQQLEEGIPLEEDFTTSPAQVEKVEGDPYTVLLTIFEGRFHQVKRMMSHVGREVTALKRTHIGTLVLDQTLEPGAYRELTTEELDRLNRKN